MSPLVFFGLAIFGLVGVLCWIALIAAREEEQGPPDVHAHDTQPH